MAALTNFYYVTLVVIGAALCSAVLHKTGHGADGAVMRENEERMKFLGYNTNISRLIFSPSREPWRGLAGRSTRFISSRFAVGHQR